MPNDTLTLEKIVTEHYLPEKRMRRRANTVEGYESSFRAHVLPNFGHLTIAGLDRDAIQAWVDTNINTAYHYYMQPVKRVMQDAQRSVASYMLRAT